MRAFATVLLAAVACGGDSEPTDRELLEGAWYVETPDKFDCVAALYFDANGTYEHDVICSLVEGGYGIEARAGEWVVNEGRLRLLTRASSCRPYDGTLSGWINYELLGENTLRLVWPEGLVVLDRLPEAGGSGGAVGAFGCFDDARVFTPQPIVSW